jgi:hypothetical protein
VASEPPETRAPPLYEPEAPPDVAPTPAIVREPGRTTVSTGSPAKEILVVPSGVVWTESGSVWAALDADFEPRVVSGVADPHGLATDGTTVYWLGAETNERWDIRSDTVSPLPGFGAQAQQQALAFGDVLFAWGQPDALWRYDGKHVQRVPFLPRRTWRVLPGFAASRRRVVLAVADVDAGFLFARVDMLGRASTVPTDILPRPGRWAVDTTGKLAFVAVERGTVVVEQAKKRRTIEGLAVELVCWCGTDVCTVAGGTLHRHQGATTTVLAENVGPATDLACGFDRVAWMTPKGDDASTIVLLGAES